MDAKLSGVWKRTALKQSIQVLMLRRWVRTMWLPSNLMQPVWQWRSNRLQWHTKTSPPTTSSGDSASPRAKRRKKGKADTKVSETKPSDEPTIMKVTQEETPKSVCIEFFEGYISGERNTFNWRNYWTWNRTRETGSRVCIVEKDNTEKKNYIKDFHQRLVNWGRGLDANLSSGR